MRRSMLILCFLILTGGLAATMANFPASSAYTFEKKVVNGINDRKLMLKNLTLNSGELAFVVMPGYATSFPQDMENYAADWYFWMRMCGGLYERMTIMRMQDLESGENGFPMFSNKDLSIPIILVPPQRTGINIQTFYNEEFDGRPPMVLLNLQVRDSKGKWKDAGHSKRKFYSYARDGEDFTIKFDDNRTGKFRAIKMTIADRDIPVEKNTWPFPSPRRHTRTWIFVQLPESDDPDNLLDHLPEAAPDIFPGPSKYTTPPEFIGKDGYPYGWIEDTEITINNLQLNDEFAFLILPLLTSSEIRSHLAPLERPDKPSLPTMMTLKTLSPPLPYFSSQDMEHPIILVSPFKTQLLVEALNGENKEIIPMELTSLKVSDGEGRWRDATEEERQFYSYRRDGENFAMTFPENKNPDFRCIAMTIRTADGYISPDGQTTPISRTWLFIQLPWTDDPDIFNHLPYTDFTVDQLNLNH